MSTGMGIWLHRCMWLGSIIILTHVHGCNGTTLVQASLYIMEDVGDGGEAITPPLPIVLPKRLRSFQNKRTTCQRFSPKQHTRK